MSKSTAVLLAIAGVVVLGLGIPIVWFAVSSFKAGWDDSDRAHAAAAASAVAASSGAPSVTVASAVATSKPPTGNVAVQDLSVADFGTNVVDVHEQGAHYVATLPPLHGTARNGVREGMVSSGAYEVRGGIEQLSGASSMRLPSTSHAGGLSTLEVAVKSGTVRVYLNGLRGSVIDGHVFVEATPGHPGRVTGYLEDWSGSSTPEETFTLEAVGGDASGVSYRVYRR